MGILVLSRFPFSTLADNGNKDLRQLMDTRKSARRTVMMCIVVMMGYVSVLVGWCVSVGDSVLGIECVVRWRGRRRDDKKADFERRRQRGCKGEGAIQYTQPIYRRQREDVKAAS